MAGSIKWLLYVDDSSNNWAYRGDESNLEDMVAAAGGAAGIGDYAATATTTFAIPRNLKPRTALFRSASNEISRRIIVPTQALFASLTGGMSFVDDTSGQTVVFVSKRGEELSVPFAADTGLIDGDNT